MSNNNITGMRYRKLIFKKRIAINLTIIKINKAVATFFKSRKRLTTKVKIHLKIKLS